MPCVAYIHKQTEYLLVQIKMEHIYIKNAITWTIFVHVLRCYNMLSTIKHILLAVNGIINICSQWYLPRSTAYRRLHINHSQLCVHHRKLRLVIQLWGSYSFVGCLRSTEIVTEGSCSWYLSLSHSDIGGSDGIRRWTVSFRYIAVIFLRRTHERHPIARPLG